MKSRLKQLPQERINTFTAEDSTFSKQLHLFRYNIVKKYAYGRLLDIGCGVGNLFNIVSSKVDYFGIDVSEEAIQKARSNYGEKSKFKIYNGTDIPFPDNFFDVVSSLEMIEHLPKQQHSIFIKEVTRLTKPGGMIVISTPNRNYPIKLIRKRYFKWNNPFHKYEFKTNEFVNFLKQHSLKIVEKIYIGDPLNLFGNFLIQRLVQSNPRFQKYLFQKGLMVSNFFKNFCNDVLVVCRN